MKKIIVIITSVAISLSALFCCTDKRNDVDVSDNTTAASQTDVPLTTPDAKPDNPESTKSPTSYFTAHQGYYVNETRESLYAGLDYLNVFGTKSYYTSPEVETYIPLDGNANDWKVSEDKYGLVDSVKVVDGRFIIKTVKAVPIYSVVDKGKITDIKSGTGYLYLKNEKNDDIAKIYVNMPVEQTKERKQTDKNIKYFLYFEKGSYSNFVDETCCLTCYIADKDGYYTIPYFTVSSACGATIDKTPVGIHTLGTREEWHSWGGMAYGQFATQYADGVYIHSPTTNGGKTQYSVGAASYNAVGSHASGGCLRMQTGSAYWFYKNCPAGTKIEIVMNNPRGTRIERPERLNKKESYDPTDPILLTGPCISPAPEPTPKVKINGIPTKYYEPMNYGKCDFNNNKPGKSLNDGNINANENKLRNDWTPSRGLPDAKQNAIWTNMGSGNIAVKLTDSEFITGDRSFGKDLDGYVYVDLKCDNLGSFLGMMFDTDEDFEGYNASKLSIIVSDGVMLKNCYGFNIVANDTIRIFVTKKGVTKYQDFKVGIDASDGFHTYHAFRFGKTKRTYFAVDNIFIGYVDFGAGTDKTGIYDKNGILVQKTDVVWSTGNFMFGFIGRNKLVYLDNIGYEQG